MKSRLLVLLLITFFLIACGGEEPAQPAPTAVSQAADPTIESPTSAPATPTATAIPTDAPPADTPMAEEAEPTPATEEPVATPHPAAQLIASFGPPVEASGDALILYGQVLDVNGDPVPDAVVEIWQTDAEGVYDHPGDSGTGSRDTSFQFYGTAAADAQGWYAFRTLVPGQYEPRPRHIHYKVVQNGITLLTSQFYFSDDIAQVEGEGMFQAVGASGDLLLLQLVAGDDGVLLANGQVVVDTGIGSGSLPLTPPQGEGPYYPVVDVSQFDNDLLVLP